MMKRRLAPEGHAARAVAPRPAGRLVAPRPAGRLAALRPMRQSAAIYGLAVGSGWIPLAGGDVDDGVVVGATGGTTASCCLSNVP